VNNQTIPNNKNEPKIERDNVTFNIPANIKRNQQGHLCITLEKAGIYRGKQRYTVNEIPDLGATVSPEVEAARWLLVRGADPMDHMAVRYPAGQGYALELTHYPTGETETILINPNTTTLANAAHLFRTNGWFTLLPLTRIVSEAEFEAILNKPFTEGRPDAATKWDDKIGAETRRRLKAEAGILIEDYFDKWRNELAARLQEEAVKWEDGRKYWRPDGIWKDTKHLGKAAYGTAMAAKLRWEAGRVLEGLADSRTAFCCSAEIRADFMAKNYELNLMRLPLRKWIQRRIDKGATLIEACRARIEHKAAKATKAAAKAKTEEAAKVAAWEFFNTEREKARQGLQSAIKLGQESFLHGGKWRVCSHKWTWRDYALANNEDPMKYVREVGADPADLDKEQADLDKEHLDDWRKQRTRRRPPVY
jgi:hypothetical protein